MKNAVYYSIILESLFQNNKRNPALEKSVRLAYTCTTAFESDLLEMKKEAEMIFEQTPYEDNAEKIADRLAVLLTNLSGKAASRKFLSLAKKTRYLQEDADKTITLWEKEI